MENVLSDSEKVFMDGGFMSEPALIQNPVCKVEVTAGAMNGKIH